jgi:hypothetical protein
MAFLVVLCPIDAFAFHIIDAGDTRSFDKQSTILFRSPLDLRLLPGLRVSAPRFGVDRTNATPSRKIKPVNETELDHETLHE